VATSWDIAREAGVSQATVSRVINGDPRVAEATRARVAAVIRRMDYTPNAIARGLVTSRTRLIGVVVSDIVNPFYPELLEAIAQRLDEHDLRMVLYNQGAGSEQTYASMLLEQRVDGIILTSAMGDSAVVKGLADRRFPFVVTNRHTRSVECDLAVGDNDAGARAVADHLLSVGHERVAVIAGNPKASTSVDRLAGFRAAWIEAGRELPEEDVVHGGFNLQDAYDQAIALLERRDPPTAIFCLNDLMAFGALNAADRLGRAVPGDVSVVGFDDISMAGWERFQLTTVHQPLAEMATAAVDLLVERVADADRSPRKLVFPSRLVVRGTTGPPPGAVR
jgi:LacI family transcriptional regulator